MKAFRILAAGLAGGLTAAWGYGLFLVASVLILGGVGAFAVFILSHRFDTDTLRGTFAWLFRLGGWCYVLAVAAFAGSTNASITARTSSGRLRAMTAGSSEVSAMRSTAVLPVWSGATTT